MANEAPYKILKRKGQYAVVNNANMVKATFDDREKALAYQRALYVNVKGAAKKADRTKWTGTRPKPKTDAAAQDLIWDVCTCGREFATEDGFKAHKISLHDAEPDPVENKINDDKIRAELDAARSFSAGERKKASESGAAMADGSYPIKNQSDANNAYKLRNNGKASPEAVMAHIRKRVKALGLKMPGASD